MSSSSPSPSSSLSLSVVSCSARSFCCVYCTRDRVETTSHEEHCVHPHDQPSLHFLLHEQAQRWDMHAACLNPELVHSLVPLAHCRDIGGYEQSSDAAQRLIRRAVVHKLSEFYAEREVRTARVFNREPEAFADRLVDKLTCGACLQVLYRPVELGCAHLLCEGCWVQWMSHSKDTGSGTCPCPTCRRPVHIDRVRSSPAIQLMVEGLQVRCVHHSSGCSDWLTVGREERNLHAHLSSCGYAPVRCDDCGQEMQRRLLRRHEVNDCAFLCPSCHRQVQTAQRKAHRNGLDSDLCIDARFCPNQCDARTMHVDDVEEHLRDCPAERVGCDICGVEYVRRDEMEHMQKAVVVHVHQQQRLIKRQREEIAELRKLVDSTHTSGHWRDGEEGQGNKRRRSTSS